MPDELIELFSEEFRRNNAAALIVADSIIILEIPDFNINHDKFIVLLTSSIQGNEFSAVCINTNPSPRNNHVIIHPNDYHFLDHVSHVDCGSYHRLFKRIFKGFTFSRTT